jgi:hypothetical protein
LRTACAAANVEHAQRRVARRTDEQRVDKRLALLGKRVATNRPIAEIEPHVASRRQLGVQPTRSVDAVRTSVGATTTTTQPTNDNNANCANQHTNPKH